MNLEQLFNKYGCDKSKRHKYHTVYERHFESIRNNSINILEVGVFKGSSTAAFHEYFPNANLYGIDIFTRVDIKSISIHKEERVQFIHADSTKPNIGDILNDTFEDIKFDIIIDDACHTPEANMLTFRHLKPFLISGGMYFIEDVWPLEIMSAKEKSISWVCNHSDELNDIKNQKFLRELNNSGLNIERFDLRKISGKPDSYIIKLQS